MISFNVRRYPYGMLGSRFVYVDTDDTGCVCDAESSAELFGPLIISTRPPPVLFIGNVIVVRHNPNILEAFRDPQNYEGCPRVQPFWNFTDGKPMAGSATDETLDYLPIDALAVGPNNHLYILLHRGEQMCIYEVDFDSGVTELRVQREAGGGMQGPVTMFRVMDNCAVVLKERGTQMVIRHLNDSKIN